MLHRRKSRTFDEALLQDICAMVIPTLQENDEPKTVRILKTPLFAIGR